MSEARDVHCAIFVERTFDVLVVRLQHFEKPGQKNEPASFKRITVEFINGSKLAALCDFECLDNKSVGCAY